MLDRIGDHKASNIKSHLPIAVRNKNTSPSRQNKSHTRLAVSRFNALLNMVKILHKSHISLPLQLRGSDLASHDGHGNTFTVIRSTFAQTRFDAAVLVTSNPRNVAIWNKQRNRKQEIAVKCVSQVQGKSKREYNSQL